MAGQLTVPSDASRPADGLCCHTVKPGLSLGRQTPFPDKPPPFTPQQPDCQGYGEGGGQALHPPTLDGEGGDLWVKRPPFTLGSKTLFGCVVAVSYLSTTSRVCWCIHRLEKGEPETACRRFAPEPVLQVEVCKPGRTAALAQADQTKTKPCRTQAAAHVILNAARPPALDWLTRVD
jgi:hypothetical protein